MSSIKDKIEIENFTSPGRTYRVDRKKYLAMRTALLKVLPKAPPGLAIAEAREKLVVALPQDLFPRGEKAGWWMKAAQLDLEAKGVIRRTASKPIRLYKVAKE